MNIADKKLLTAKYAVCPECGSDKVDNGEGFVNVVSSVFTRSCNCGYTVTVNKREKTQSTVTEDVLSEEPVKKGNANFRGMPF